MLNEGLLIWYYGDVFHKLNMCKVLVHILFGSRASHTANWNKNGYKQDYMNVLVTVYKIHTLSHNVYADTCKLQI